MDEFERLPDEFSVLKENEEKSPRHIIAARLKDAAKEKNKLRKATQLLCASAATVAIVTSNVTPVSMTHFSLLWEGVYDKERNTVQLNDVRPDNEGGLVGTDFFLGSDTVTIEFDYFVGNEENSVSDKLEEGILVSFSDSQTEMKYNPDHVNKHRAKEERYDGLFGLDIAINSDNHSSKDHIAIIGNDIDDVKQIVEYDYLENIVHHVKMTYDNHDLEVEHDDQVIKVNNIKVPDNKSIYMTISSSTGRRYASAMIHNIKINNEPIVIDNPNHNNTATLCITINWLTSQVIPHELENGEVEEICSKCHNEGKIPCTTCFTKGSFNGQLCLSCGGKGWRSCDRCGRQAEITLEDQNRIDEVKKEIYPNEITCSECNGHGLICLGDPNADDPEGCHGEVYVQCKACDNTGYQNGELCSWCKGTLTHMCPSFESHYTCPKCEGKGTVSE